MDVFCIDVAVILSAVLPLKPLRILASQSLFESIDVEPVFLSVICEYCHMSMLMSCFPLKGQGNKMYFQ